MATTKRSSTEERLADPLVGATVAIDARLVGYAAGIAQYVTQLARALVASHPAESYLVLQARRSHAPLARGQRVRSIRCLTPPHHPLERWSLPAELALRRPRPTLLHSVDHVAPAWGPWRSVVTLHDLTFWLYPETQTPASRAYYAAAGVSARRAERVITVSHSTARDAIRLLALDPARVRVVHEAAGPAFNPRPRAELVALAGRLGFDPDRPYVLFVGTMEPRKNIPLLLEAFARVRRSLDTQLLLVGGRGWLDEPIYDAHARLGLGETARFLGPLPETDLAVLYSHAGVFAFPSLYEGFGLVLLEAMACGAPVVSSCAGPMPEVAADAALLLDPGDPAPWADALARVLGDDSAAQDLRRRGFARAAGFSWEEAARATRDVYREALSA